MLALNDEKGVATKNNKTIFFLPPLLERRKIGRIKSTRDPDTFEKYRDTPPISIAILLQKYAPPSRQK